MCVALSTDARESIAIVGHHGREVLAELVQAAAREGIDLSFVFGREGIEVEERHLGRRSGGGEIQTRHAVFVTERAAVEIQAQRCAAEQEVGAIEPFGGEAFETKVAEGFEGRAHLLKARRIDAVGRGSGVIFLPIDHFDTVGQGDAVANPAIQFAVAVVFGAGVHHAVGRKAFVAATAEGSGGEQEGACGGQSA